VVVNLGDSIELVVTREGISVKQKLSYAHECFTFGEWDNACEVVALVREVMQR
jgi:hypothetical protein